MCVGVWSAERVKSESQQQHRQRIQHVQLLNYLHICYVFSTNVVDFKTRKNDELLIIKVKIVSTLLVAKEDGHLSAVVNGPGS